MLLLPGGQYAKTVSWKSLTQRKKKTFAEMMQYIVLTATICDTLSNQINTR